MTTLRFPKCFDLAEVPADWKLVRLSLDWDGRPLLLFVEGKLPEPDPTMDRKAWSRWYQTPPKAHHLVCEQSGKLHTVTFEQSQGLSTFHVQRFEDGWLLGDRREGKATVYDAHGAVRRVLDPGDASEDIQTTAEGHIWVSYFDEGVFGRGIGREGLVCFDREGTPPPSRAVGMWETPAAPAASKRRWEAWDSFTFHPFRGCGISMGACSD